MEKIVATVKHLPTCSQRQARKPAVAIASHHRSCPKFTTLHHLAVAFLSVCMHISANNLNCEEILGAKQDDAATSAESVQNCALACHIVRTGSYFVS